MARMEPMEYTKRVREMVVNAVAELEAASKLMAEHGDVHRCADIDIAIQHAEAAIET